MYVVTARNEDMPDNTWDFWVSNSDIFDARELDSIMDEYYYYDTVEAHEFTVGNTHPAVRYVRDQLVSSMYGAPRCRHPEYAHGRCAEIACDNYVNKHREH